MRVAAETAYPTPATSLYRRCRSANAAPPRAAKIASAWYAPLNAPNSNRVNPSWNVRNSGTTELTISEEMSVKKLVKPRPTTFPLTSGRQRLRGAGCGSVRGARSPRRDGYNRASLRSVGLRAHAAI